MINCMHALGYPCLAVRCTSLLDGKQLEECVGNPGDLERLRKRFAELIMDRHGSEREEDCWVYVSLLRRTFATLKQVY